MGRYGAAFLRFQLEVAMDTRVRTESGDGSSPRSTGVRTLALASVVVLVLAIVVVAPLIGDSEEDPSAAAGVPEVATVLAVVDAWNDFDADAYAVHWADGASGYGPFGPSKSGRLTVVGSAEMDQAMAAFHAVGGTITVSDCELNARTVTCEETFDDPRYGTAVTVGTSYTFDSDLKIGGFTYTNAIPDEVDDFHVSLAGWMETEHPEAFETYFTPGFYSLRYESWQSPETVEELVPLIDEFIAQSDVFPLSP